MTFPLFFFFFFLSVRNAIHYFVKISLLAQYSYTFACTLLCYYFYYPPKVSNFIMGSINNGRISFALCQAGSPGNVLVFINEQCQNSFANSREFVSIIRNSFTTTYESLQFFYARMLHSEQSITHNNYATSKHHPVLLCLQSTSACQAVQQLLLPVCAYLS